MSNPKPGNIRSAGQVDEHGRSVDAFLDFLEQYLDSIDS
jgi:hypothetical protein